PFIRKEPEALVPPVIQFGYIQRTRRLHTKEVLTQERLCRFGSIIEECVCVQRIVSMLIEHAPVKAIASRRSDEAYLGNASTSIRTHRSYRDAELTGCV